MSHDDEYHANMVSMLELIWGEGYMAPGGPGNVAKLLDGIDLETPLIERARASAQRLGLADRCSFRVVEPGPLPFADASFDIVISSGAVTQTADAAALFAEARRVLGPGGWLSCYEWLRTDRDYSEDMQYWFRMEGLTYAMKTFGDYEALLRGAGFTEVKTEDATAWYRDEAGREYDLIRGELYPEMRELLGTADADHFVENWRAMLVVIDSGEMRQGYLRGRRPAAA